MGVRKGLNSLEVIGKEISVDNRLWKHYPTELLPLSDFPIFICVTQQRTIFVSGWYFPILFLFRIYFGLFLMPVFRLFLLWTPYLECRCLHRCFPASAWWTVCCLESERGIFRCSSCQQSLRFFCPVPANFYAVCEQQGLRFTFIICVSVARSLLWFLRLSFWFLVALRYFRTLLCFKITRSSPICLRSTLNGFRRVVTSDVQGCDELLICLANHTFAFWLRRKWTGGGFRLGAVLK